MTIGIDSRQTFFTAQQLARALNVSQQRVSQLIEEGKIVPDVQIGKRGAFTAEQVGRIVVQRASK